MTGEEPRLHALARLAVAVVTHQPEELRRFAAAAGPGDRRDPQLRETLLQCHVFCGFPRTLACLDVLASAGFRIEAADEGPEPPAEDLVERGAGLFDAIYGDRAGTIRGHLAGLDPAFARWIAEHAYGRVMTRGGLAGDKRELLAVAMLAALGHDRQLASHARGAVRCGAEAAEVHGVIEACGDLMSPERKARALEIADSFAGRP